VKRLAGVVVAGRQEGVAGGHGREAHRLLARDAQPDQPAPVVADERHPLDAVGAERVQKAAHPADVSLVAVVVRAGRLVGTAEADEVGGDGPVPGRDQRAHHVTPQVRPRGLAVQEQDDVRPPRSFVDVVHPERRSIGRRHGEVARRERIVAEPGKALIGRSEHVHGHLGSGAHSAEEEDEALEEENAWRTLPGCTGPP
jgi:hypothetical protein